MERITRILFAQRQIITQGRALASKHNTAISELGFANASSYPFNPRVPLPQQWTTTRALSSISPSIGRLRSLNFVQNVLDEDSQRQSKMDIVHILMKRKKTFVTVTDEQGNKKFGASAGSLEETKGRSRQSRYAAESTAEQVGRTCRKMGLKSVVIKVKGAVYFRKKRKVILSWRDGFRGEGLGARTRILSVQDETQLAHNGCRLPKKRRI